MKSVCLEFLIIRVTLGLQLSKLLIDERACTVFSLNNVSPKPANYHSVVLPRILRLKALKGTLT
jgi:hypothetical protein